MILTRFPVRDPLTDSQGLATGVWQKWFASLVSLFNAAKFAAVTLTGAPPIVAGGEIAIGGTTSLTVGAAGASAVLPATPELMININVNGIALKIPAYRA